MLPGRPRSLCALFAVLILPQGAAGALWQAGPEVLQGEGAGDSVRGVVFEDRNGDGRRQSGEPGIADVLVSNGREIVATDASGRYRIAVRADMDLSIVKPAGWRAPVDRRGVPQIAYSYLRDGSPTLRYEGLPRQGKAPEQVNFPLQRGAGAEADFECVVIGDSQTYSNDEIGHFRDSTVADLAGRGVAPDCLIYVGDVVGDDLDLLDRLLEVGAAVGAPQWLVHGNHDIDFDARDPARATDSWRARAMPPYYAFAMGDVVFVALSNIVYPCSGARDFCAQEKPQYNGRVPEAQLQWLEKLLARVDRERRVVLLHHIPLVSFVDAGSPKHQTDNAAAVHALLEGRPALSVAGHTHTVENHAPGQHFAGWREQAGVGALPFRHLIAGAASGAWWQGDFGTDGTPMALQRMGAPKGYLQLRFVGTEYRERYFGAGLGPTRRQWIGLSTPAFRDWFAAIDAWRGRDAADRHPLPPRSRQDLPDRYLLTPRDLREGVFVTANVWDGSAETEVRARIDDGAPLAMARNQQGEGEAPRIGADYADPFSAAHQLSVARFAMRSRDGEARAQGYESFRGATRRGPPQPQFGVADRNMHLWRVRMPSGLSPGVHRLQVTSTDRHGRSTTDTLVFELRDARPPRFWRREAWQEAD